MRKIVSRLSLVIVVIFACVCLIPLISPAQPKGPRTPFPLSTPFPYTYDVRTVKTVSGTVKRITPMKTMSHDVVILIVETAEKEEYTVNLGPVWYFMRQGFSIKEGDKVEVTGSDVRVGSRNMLLGAKVIKGDSILELRDSNGIPYWEGPGKR